MIVHQIEALKEAGCDDVVLAINYRPQVRSHVSCQPWQVEVEPATRRAIDTCLPNVCDTAAAAPLLLHVFACRLQVVVVACQQAELPAS